MNDHLILSEACFYLCNFQKTIFKSSDNQISSTILHEFQDKWEYYISNGILFLARLINYYSDKLSETSTLLLNAVVNSENSILDAMRLFEEYVKLIYQIKLEIDYLETGAINCQGHNRELLLMRSSMDRSSSLTKHSDNARNVLNVLKGYIRSSSIPNEVEHTNNLKYSCLSFDGMRVLHLQFQIFFKGSKIKSPDLLYDPQIESLQHLRRLVISEIKNTDGSFLNHINCIFYRKNIQNGIVSYGIKGYTSPKVIDTTELIIPGGSGFYCERTIPLDWNNKKRKT